MTRDRLRPGAALGPHSIVEATIGEGGMGVVYRARDTRLGRSVALKVLSGVPADSPDSLRRFEQEARTARGSVRRLEKRRRRSPDPGRGPEGIRIRYTAPLMEDTPCPCTQECRAGTFS